MINKQFKLMTEQMSIKLSSSTQNNQMTRYWDNWTDGMAQGTLINHYKKEISLHNTVNLWIEAYKMVTP